MDVAGPGREQESDARPQNYLCGGKKREKTTKITHQWCWCGTRLQTQAPATGLWLPHVVKPRSSSLPPLLFGRVITIKGMSSPLQLHPQFAIQVYPAGPPSLMDTSTQLCLQLQGRKKKKLLWKTSPGETPQQRMWETDVLLNAFCSGHW